jgi:hypothetical protein
MVIALLVITLAILCAVAVMMRKSRAEAKERSLAEDIGEVIFDDGDEVAAKHRGDDVVCPDCLDSFDADLIYCPRDGRRLVLASEIDEVDGRVCPVCSRGFTLAICFCPHDGAALVVADPRRARRLATAPGVGGLEQKGKICPRCRARHQFSYTFCTEDGSELRVLN